jgi:hypothetical protein
MLVGRRHDARTRGMAVLEATLIAAFLMVFVMGGFALLMRSARGPTELGGTVGQLQEIGRRIIAEVSDDLKNTGIHQTGGANFPAIFERPIGDDKTPRGKQVASMSIDDANNAQYQWARSGDQSRIARNRNRACDELVFTPIDATVVDGANTFASWPLDILNNDQLKWADANQVNYRVVTDVTGTPWLERRINDRNPRKIGPFVQNITFDCLGSDRTLLYNQVAIVVYLSHRLSSGRVINTAIEGVVNLGIQRQL